MARATRGYLAGIGTSGSLLAGAVLMFILASALVAFRGWPHVAAQPSPGEVVVSPRPASAFASSAGRRLTLLAAPAPAGLATGAARRAAGRVGAGLPAARRGPGAGTRQSIGTPASTSLASSAPAVPAGGGSAAQSGCGSCGSGSPPSPAPALQQVTSGLGNVVAGAGSTVGSAVQQTTGAVGGAVGTVSPAVGSTVSGVGSGAAQTIQGATQGVAGVISGLGQKLDGH